MIRQCVPSYLVLATWATGYHGAAKFKPSCADIWVIGTMWTEKQECSPELNISRSISVSLVVIVIAVGVDTVAITKSSRCAISYTRNLTRKLAATSLLLTLV